MKINEERKLKTKRYVIKIEKYNPDLFQWRKSWGRKMFDRRLPTWRLRQSSKRWLECYRRGTSSEKGSDWVYQSQPLLHQHHTAPWWEWPNTLGGISSHRAGSMTSRPEKCRTPRPWKKHWSWRSTKVIFCRMEVSCLTIWSDLKQIDPRVLDYAASKVQAGFRGWQARQNLKKK